MIRTINSTILRSRLRHKVYSMLIDLLKINNSLHNHPTSINIQTIIITIHKTINTTIHKTINMIFHKINSLLYNKNTLTNLLSNSNSSSNNTNSSSSNTNSNSNSNKNKKRRERRMRRYRDYLEKDRNLRNRWKN